MHGRIRRHLSFANVVSVLALFVALGGGAYAAFSLPKNSVKSKHIVNDQVKPGDVRDDTLPGGGLGTADIAPDALSGDDINETSLGKVPSATDADSLGGIGSGGFVQGSAKFYSNRVTVPTNTEYSPVLPIPGIGTIYGSCTNASEVSMNFGNSTSEGIYGVVDDGGTDPSQSFVFGQGAATVLTPKAGRELVIFQVGRDESANHDLATIWATGQGGNPCVVQVQAIAHTN